MFRAAHPDAPAPVYVIGSEVPIPGGAMENEETVAVTKPEDCKATLEAFRAAADGKATKIIIPSEIQGLAGLAAGIQAMVEPEKQEKK